MIDKNEVRDMLIEGKTTKEISEELGCSDRRVQQISLKNGWKNIPKGRVSEIVKMIKEGRSVNDITNKIDVSESTVYYIKNSDKYTDAKSAPPVKERKNARKTIKKRTMGDWTENAFNYIQRKCLKDSSSEGWSRDLRNEIEGDLVDFMMYIDSLDDVKNKEFYFKKSTKSRIIKFLENKKKYDITHRSILHTSNDGGDDSVFLGEEECGHNNNPEDLLTYREFLEE